MTHGRFGSYQCPGGKDCDHPAAISSRIAERAIIEYVQETLRGVSETSASDQVTLEAGEVLEAAQHALDAAVEAFSGLDDVASAAAKLRELQASRDAAQVAYDDAIAKQRVAGITVSADDWDRLTADEQRDLISVVIERASVSPGRGADRLEILGR